MLLFSSLCYWEVLASAYRVVQHLQSLKSATAVYHPLSSFLTQVMMPRWVWGVVRLLMHLGAIKLLLVDCCCCFSCVWSVRPSSPWRLPHLKCLFVIACMSNVQTLGGLHAWVAWPMSQLTLRPLCKGHAYCKCLTLSICICDTSLALIS